MNVLEEIRKEHGEFRSLVLQINKHAKYLLKKNLQKNTSPLNLLWKSIKKFKKKIKPVIKAFKIQTIACI